MTTVDKEVERELKRYRQQVGRELTESEVTEIHRSPKMHGWVRHCRTNHEHNAKRLRAQGWCLSEGDHGYWTRKN